mmetsp:Transcript_28598/g.38129  ORF Transcript_28598/g.38129 Transcript_28598/m.38129 type:complete len:135 (-) Transcript_28598:429-833(-)
MEEAWKIYNEEEANKKLEREKKILRNLRKLELKKQKVIEKLIKHDVQVKERKAQQDQAIELKRELSLCMVEERKQLQQTMKHIEKLETKSVDQALAKQSVDGAPVIPKKKGNRYGLHKAEGEFAQSGGNGHSGW